MPTTPTPIPKPDELNPSAPLSPPDSEIASDRLDEVANLLSDFYELLVDMAYLPQGSILYPPHVEVAPRLVKREMIYQGLDTLVAPFLQKIPYIDVNVSEHCEILPDSKIVVYGRYQAIEDSRDPYLIKGKMQKKYEYIEPWVVPISTPARRGVGTTLLFDVRTGTSHRPI